MTSRDPDWIQTNDPQLRRLLLYSAELPDRVFETGRKYTINPVSERISA